MPSITTIYIPEAAQTITERILREAAKQPVLFLVSGGSATEIAAHVIRMVDTHELNFPITVAQIDERYGPVGHKDANWPKLMEKVGDVARVSLHPILDGSSRDDTVTTYENFLQFHRDDFIVGLLGVGLDAHTAGILPNSVAAQEQEKWVAGYQGPDYNRVTVTFPFFKEINWAVLYAQGAQKHGVLTGLDEQKDPRISPVHALKQVADLTIMYTP